MEDERVYQEMAAQKPMAPNHGMLGGLSGQGRIQKTSGVGGQIDTLMVEAEQLMQVTNKLMEELSPVLLPPTPMPEGGVAQAPDANKSAQAERIEQEIWKIRRCKLMIVEMSQRLDL
jgi:hypothetical protein